MLRHVSAMGGSFSEDFEGSSGDNGRSFERVERDYCMRCRTGVLRAAVGGLEDP